MRTGGGLTEQGRQAAENATGPSANVRGGAALEAEDGRIFTGCNVEIASYGGTICAERTAACKAVSEGCRSFRRIAVTGPSEDFCTPCGICRQFLSEFSPDMLVISERTDGEYLSTPLSELLPHTFRL